MRSALLLSLLCLSGCQSSSLDDQRDMHEAIGITFCDAGGLDRLSTIDNHGRLTNFTCTNGLSGVLPTQFVFESDEDYVNKYYEQFLTLKLERCSQEGDTVSMFNIQSIGSTLRYHMSCKHSGRFSVDKGYFDSLEEQSALITKLESICESAPFSLTSITNDSPVKRSYKFKCGRAKYSIDSSITPDEIHAINATYCEHDGFSSLTASQINSITNTKQATFECRSGFNTTVKF